MRRALSAVCLFSLLGLVPGHAGAAAARFAPIGPDDGSVRLLAADPAVPRVLLAVGQHSGDLYRSVDGGVSWTHPLPGLAAAATVTPHPRRPGVFYAATRFGFLQRSDDGGQHWVQLGRISGPAAELPLAVAPGSPDVLYASDSTLRLLQKSTDGGASFRTIVRNFRGPFFLDPNRPTTLYADGPSGPIRSTNGGGRWSALPAIAGVPASATGLLGVAATVPTSLYAATPRGVYRSRDGGQTWRRTGWTAASLGLRLTVDPAVPSRLYLAGAPLAGVAVSRDGGDSWQRRRQSPLVGTVDTLAVGASGLVFAQAHGGVVERTAPGVDVWQAGSHRGLLESHPEQLVFSPVDPDLLYLVRSVWTTGMGPDRVELWWSQDRGRTWEPWSAPVPPPPDGFTALPVRLAIDPDHPERLVLGTWKGLFESRAGDPAWTLVEGVGFPSEVDQLAFAEGSLLLGACGLSRSPDGGHSLTPVVPCETPFLRRYVAQLAVDPHRPARVYASFYEVPRYPILGAPVVFFLVRSEDAGRTWTEIRRGTDYPQPVVDLLHPGSLYLLAEALYHSDDAGTTWERLGDKPGTVLVADPVSLGILYAASASAGVRTSVDGGRTFTPDGDGLADYGREGVISLTAHPSLPGVLYAFPDKGGLFVRPSPQ